MVNPIKREVISKRQLDRLVEKARNDALEEAAVVAATKFKWPVSNLQVANAIRALKRGAHH